MKKKSNIYPCFYSEMCDDAKTLIQGRQLGTDLIHLFVSVIPARLYIFDLQLNKYGMSEIKFDLCLTTCHFIIRNESV